MNFGELLGIIAGAMVMTWVSILIGAYVMFKGKSSVPGEKFLGGAPKGQVFTIPEAVEGAEFPEVEQNVLKKTEEFLKVLGGRL